MNNSNPYFPNWAKTTTTFNWRSGFDASGEPGDFRVRLIRPRVTLRKGVDMPQWRPSDPAMRAAWTASRTTLRGHERRHEGIGDRWKTELQSRLAGLTLTSYAETEAEAEAEGPELVGPDWETWLGEVQTDHDAIDPYTAPFACPEEREAEAPESEESAAG